MLDAWLRAVARLHLSYAQSSIVALSSDLGATAELRTQLVAMSSIQASGIGYGEALDCRRFQCSERGGQAWMRTIRSRHQIADDRRRALRASA